MIRLWGIHFFQSLDNWDRWKAKSTMNAGINQLWIRGDVGDQAAQIKVAGVKSAGLDFLKFALDQ